MSSNGVSIYLYPYPHGGTGVMIDGKEMQEVRDIRFEHKVGELPTLTLEVNAPPDFELEMPDAHVIVNVLVLPGYELVCEHQTGRELYFARPRNP